MLAYCVSSVTVNNSPIQDYVHPDDHAQLTLRNDSWVQTFHSISITVIYYFSGAYMALWGSLSEVCK